MLQNLTKPQEGETAAESIQIALAASAPNGNNTLISPLHTPEGSRHGSDEPAAAGAAATFGNAAYFAVITFTTVGLGDFAPPSRPASLRVDGVGVDAAMRAGSYTTTRRMRTWSANTSFSRRRRCWVSCC